MDEASKTLSHYSEILNKYLTGRILEIGAGLDPITNTCEIFDLAQGNAQFISDFFPPSSFDTVFSSHCLEHMIDPLTAVKSWFSLVKPGGHLIIIVPDEDLYEQGHFPSQFNSDHKATFTISKSRSWSEVSINCLDICNTLGGTIVYLQQQSDNYNFDLNTFGYLGISKYRLLRRLLQNSRVKSLARSLKLIPIDQTSLGNDVLAQIVFILKK